MAEKGDMVRHLVYPSNVGRRLDMGWKLVEGGGPSGHHYAQGAVLMEIPREKYEEWLKTVRQPFEELYTSVRPGTLPIETEEPGIVGEMKITKKEASRITRVGGKK